MSHSDTSKRKRDKTLYNERRKKVKGKAIRIMPLPWQEFEKVLFALGCEFVEQKRSSHRKYRKAGLLRPITVPANTKEVAEYIIKSNLKTLGISREEYLEVLNGL